jgi:hypothetical protein
MAKATDQQSPRRSQNRFLVVLLASAALISAARDLGRLQDLSRGLVGIASTVHQTVQAAVHSAPASPSCPQTVAQNENSAQPFNWNSRVAPQLIEIIGQGGNDARPAVNPAVKRAADIQLQLIAAQASCSDLATMNIQTAPHSEAIRIISRRRHENSPRVRNRSANQTANIYVRSPDQQFDFTVRVPGAFESVRRAIDNELKTAMMVSSDPPAADICPTRTLRIRSLSLNGRLDLLAEYLPLITQRRTLDQEASPGSEETSCAGTIEVRTARGTVSLDLLRILKTSIEVENSKSDTTSDLPQTLKALIERSISAAPAENEDAH